MGAQVETPAADLADRLLRIWREASGEAAEQLRPFVSNLALQMYAPNHVAPAWRLARTALLERGAPFAVHAELYAAASDLTQSAEHAPAPPLPVWWPDMDARQESNLAQLIERLGFEDYAALHRWSTESPEDYWLTTLDSLTTQFDEPALATRGSPDLEAPEWFRGARWNVAEACLHGAPDSLALIVSKGSESCRVTRGELRLEVLRAAAGLTQLGVTPRDNVAVALPWGFDAVVWYLAVLYVGAPVVCVAESYSIAEIRVRLELTQPQWVITTDVIRRAGKQLPLYEKFVAAGAPRTLLVGHGADCTARSEDVCGRELLVNQQLGAPRPFATPIDATNTVLFSSGTTGTPKAIPWTPGCALKAAADAKWHLDVRIGDRLVWPTSLGWMMGAWSIFATLLNQATLVLFDDAPTTRDFGEFVANNRVTHLGVVPSLVKIWKETRCMEGLDWSSLRLFSSTGECSNPVDMLYLMWLAGYRPVIEYCGGTEIAGGYITGTLLQPCVPSCFTTPALGQAFVVLDERGQPAQEGEAFLTCASPGLSTRLLNRDHHKEYFAGTPWSGLRRHGDLVRTLPDGYFRVLGRADDTMNLGGIKVSSAEIERACHDLPGVGDVAAVAVSPSGGGPSELVLVVVPQHPLDDQRTATLEALVRERVRQGVNPLFKVSRVVCVDALPRTASNKVMRRVLRTWCAVGAAEATLARPVEDCSLSRSSNVAERKLS